MRNIEIQIDSRLEALKNNFSKRLQKSGDKPVLFRREIEVHELLFDEKKLPLNPLVSSNNRPLNDKGLKYTDGDIVRIREAYVNYIVNGAKLSDSGEWYYVSKGSIKDNDTYTIDDKGRYLKKFPPGNTEIYFYSESKIRFSYLQWLLVSLNSQNDEKPFDSLYRARAFCIYMMYKNGRIEADDMNSRKKIIDIINREFPPEVKTAGKQTYDELKSKEKIFVDFDTVKVNHKLDFEYGQKLYLMKFPET